MESIAEALLETKSSLQRSCKISYSRIMCKHKKRKLVPRLNYVMHALFTKISVWDNLIFRPLSFFITLRRTIFILIRSVNRGILIMLLTNKLSANAIYLFRGGKWNIIQFDSEILPHVIFWNKTGKSIRTGELGW